MTSKIRDEEQEVDLFGNLLVPPKDLRGRKAYGKSSQNQELVANLRAFGKTHDQIAAVLGCDAKTLRKYYSRELDQGSLILEAEAISVLVRKMKSGNIAATKHVLEMASLQTMPTRKPEEQKAVRDPVGKKEMLARDASQPPAGWGDILGAKRPN